MSNSSFFSSLNLKEGPNLPKQASVRDWGGGAAETFSGKEFDGAGTFSENKIDWGGDFFRK